MTHNSPSHYRPRGAIPSRARVLAPWGADTTPAALCALAAAVFFSLCLLLSMNNHERWSFAAALLMSICIDGALWFRVIKNDTRSFALKFSFAIQWLKKLAPLGVCLSLPLNMDYLFPWGEYILSSPIKAVGGSLLMSFAITLVYLLTSKQPEPGGRPPGLKQLIALAGPRLEYFLIFAALVVLSRWVTVLYVGNPIFYLARILASLLTLAPFFAGYTAFRFWKSTLVWLIVLALGVVASYATGSRGMAFYPIIFFLAGFMLSLPTWRQRIKWGLLIVIPTAALLATLGVRIGIARNIVGRMSIVDALKQGSIMQSVTEGEITSVADVQGGTAFKTFRRLTSWPPYVIPTMTPDPVPFRGFGDFLWQVRGAFELGIIALVSEDYRGPFYFDNIHLQPYGFAVHIGADMRKVSNVEFPMHMESFTRGGWIPALLFPFVAYYALFSAERLLRRALLRKYPAVFFFMLMLLCLFGAVSFLRSSFIESMRNMVIKGCFGLLVFYLFDRILVEWFGVRNHLRRQRKPIQYGY